MAAYLILGPLLGALLLSCVAVLPELRRPEATFAGLVTALYLFFIFFGLLFAYVGGAAAALASGVAHIASRGLNRVTAMVCVSGVAALAQVAFLASIDTTRSFSGVAFFVPVAAATAAFLNGFIRWREKSTCAACGNPASQSSREGNMRPKRFR